MGSLVRSSLNTLSETATVLRRVGSAACCATYRRYLNLRRRCDPVPSIRICTKTRRAFRETVVFDAVLRQTSALSWRSGRNEAWLAETGPPGPRSSEPVSGGYVRPRAADVPTALHAARAGVGSGLPERLSTTEATTTTVTVGSQGKSVHTEAEFAHQVISCDDGDVTAFMSIADHGAMASANGQLGETRVCEPVRRAIDASRDPLTGLANRTAFADATERLARHAASNHRLIAVVIADIRELGDVNETLGHWAGDSVVQTMAERLREEPSFCIEPARFGAGAFAWCVDGGRQDEAAVLSQVNEQVDRWTRLPVELAGVTLRLEAAVGVVFIPTHGQSASKLLQRAERALSQAKGQRRRTALAYDQRLDIGGARRLTLATALRDAIDAREISVAYQPKVRVADRQTIGCEALARWWHPRLGDIGPDEFIPLAERTGLITDLTIAVLHASIMTQRRWLKAGKNLSLAVNVSTAALRDRDFVVRLSDLVARGAIDPCRLTLEVTESVAVTDSKQAVDALQALADQGFTISLDDFGSGYSSLNYLNQLPASELKLDRSFAARVTHSPTVHTIVSSIIRLAHDLGLTVVAEGIEDEATWDALAALDCDVVQGYLVAPPLSGEDLEAWLRELNRATGPPTGQG